jgi:hypothetical protein
MWGRHRPRRPLATETISGFPPQPALKARNGGGAAQGRDLQLRVGHDPADAIKGIEGRTTDSDQHGLGGRAADDKADIEGSAGANLGQTREIDQPRAGESVIGGIIVDLGQGPAVVAGCAGDGGGITAADRRQVFATTAESRLPYWSGRKPRWPRRRFQPQWHCWPECPSPSSTPPSYGCFAPPPSGSGRSSRPGRRRRSRDRSMGLPRESARVRAARAGCRR